jgi:hypothetical protein
LLYSFEAGNISARVVVSINRVTLLAVLIGAVSVGLIRVTAADSIPLDQQGGVWTVSVRINDAISLPFVLDSGAADVSITADVYMTLKRMGSVSPADIIGYTNYRIADGSTLREPNFRIRSLRVGNTDLRDVYCSVAPPRGDLLLGQTALSRLPRWSIDYQRRVLVVGEVGGAPTSPSVRETSINSPTSAAPSAPPRDDPEPDYACGAAQNFCREGVHLCAVYRNDFLRVGRVCAGVTDAAFPGSTQPNNENDPDYACRAAQSFCRDGVHLCDVYRNEFRQAGRACPGVTYATEQ